MLPRPDKRGKQLQKNSEAEEYEVRDVCVIYNLSTSDGDAPASPLAS